MDAKVLMTPHRHLALQLLRGERSVFLIRFANASDLECSLESIDRVDNEFNVANSLLPKKLASMFQRSFYPRSTFIDALLIKLINEKGFHIMDVKKATMKELVEAYNAKASKPVKRFADRLSAEKRVLAMLNGEAAPAATEVAVDTSTTTTQEEATMAAAKKKTTKKNGNGKPANATKKDVTRSQATAASWANKRVAKQRATKNKVTVDGKEFNSVLAAFTALKLPVGKHIKFRAELKQSESGSKSFEGHRFKIVPAGE